jgi:hypothetical protein
MVLSRYARPWSAYIFFHRRVELPCMLMLQSL